MDEHKYVVVITAASRQEADRVMAERLGYDEDYGFSYRIPPWEELHEPSLAEEFQLVAGQEEVAHCGCGQVIIKFRGVWYHAYNPALTGADDHLAGPG